MISPITLGRIVTASSQSEAQQIFRARKNHGIAGVIFSPDIIIPTWNGHQRLLLANNTQHINPLTGTFVIQRELTEEWRRIAGKLTKELVALSNLFNRSGRTRTIRYVINDALEEVAHVDEEALHGWLHIHVAGEGMMCANPVGDNPVQVKTLKGHSDLMDETDLHRLISVEKKVELITLQKNQAIAFDDSMVHLSNRGPRFRILALD